MFEAKRVFFIFPGYQPIFSTERSSFSTIGFQSNRRSDAATFGPIPSILFRSFAEAFKAPSGLPKAEMRRLKRTLPTPGAMDKATQ